MGSSQSTQAAVEFIFHWHLELKERLIFESGPSVISQYLEAVDKILQSPPREELKESISMIVARLKFEFRTVLTQQTESAMGSTSITELSSSITDTTSYQFRYEDYVLYESPKRDVADYLRSIVVRSNSCGNLKALTEVYISVRKQFVDWIIKKLRFDELQTGDTKKFLREELKMKTQRWVQAAKICFKLLFLREKQIAKQIFGELGDSIANESFLHIVKDAMVNLFRFVQNVSSSSQTHERLEIILILCNALFSLVPDVNALFQFESGKGIRTSVGQILSGLQDEVKRMLSDFENSVLREVSNVDKTGAVQPLTKYVMDYLNLLVNHMKLLMNVIVSRPSMTIGSLEFPDDVLQESGNLSPLSLHIVLIIAVLQRNLEVKGQKSDNALCRYLIMMNNIQYIVQKIKGSKDLQEMVGNDYMKKLNNNLSEAMDQFQALACENLLLCLKEEDLYVSRCFCHGVSTRALRKQIKKFNSFYDDLHVVQSSWIIPDTSMREELCGLTTQKLVPAYESFLEKFRNHLKIENNNKPRILSFSKVPIKYSVKDLNDLVLKGYQPPPSTQVPAESFPVSVSDRDRG